MAYIILFFELFLNVLDGIHNRKFNHEVWQRLIITRVTKLTPINHISEMVILTTNLLSKVYLVSAKFS